MHYIRLLRAPKLTYEKGRKHPWSLNVVLSVTTDLGDSFLNPDDNGPIKLKVSAGWEQPSKQQTAESMILAAEKSLRWTPGMRVLKADIPAQHLTAASLPNPGPGPLRVFIRAGASRSAELATSVALAGFQGDCGKVMPVWADVQTPDSDEAPTTCLRRLAHGDRKSEPFIEIEEDIGESIARHIWDAGLVAVSRVWLVNDRKSHNAARHPWHMDEFHGLLFRRGPLNILELGCGVGILGNGLAQIMTREDPEGKSSILMTDLPEAEQRATANIAHLARAGTASIHPEYENLDWDDGRKGQLGPLVRAKTWDLIVMSDCTYNVDVLPSLINTWTAVHVHNLSKSPLGSAQTHVYVAWKKRHPDENEFWNLVDDAGWILQEEDVVDLPVLGDETQKIFSYLFETHSRKYERVAETGTWKCLDRAGLKPRSGG
ncbi:UPF0665 family protein C [Colletotrichum tofieldiae]|uniref:UPF0665 family protein C n=1 Tax=Colletotrichum tofieldiae TaxID=708197 RepID=A0A166VDT2_9PEZI|nr:UPF0665 family protein C [Colletotrichum tofieldiae]GKT94056.1 UPF0665 family protein C [Colletotrichum tofieldiae]